jgi:2,4-dienoyl-CoA reductase-like NADH-dependent reductase (Old Yellow Enzyme family)
MPDPFTQPLLEPYRLGDLLLRNRIVMAPLTRTRAVNLGHIATDLMREYYAQRAAAGLIITEGAWVSEAGQGWYGAPGIYNISNDVGCVKELGLFFHDFRYTFHVSAHALVPFERVTILRR